MNEKRRNLILIVFFIMLLTIISIISYYWYNNTYFVSTEDAKVTADIVKISPQISGKIIEFNMVEGQKVIKDQILARMDLLNQPSSTLEMAIIRAPVSGLIIKTQGNAGEMASQAQVLGMLVVPEEFYITANIDETKLARIKIGQPVDITIDELEGKKFTGKVKFIGRASNSTFSLLPATSGATFTKVVQTIPVKIKLDKHDTEFAPGTNATVKIHIR